MESLWRVDPKLCSQCAVLLLLYTSTKLCPSALGQRVVAPLLHRATLLGANRQENCFKIALMCLGEAGGRFFAAYILLS